MKITNLSDFNPNHFRISINVSEDFTPDAISIGDFLIQKAKLLIELGEQLNRTDSCDTELEIKNLGMKDKFEVTGEY